MVLAEHIVHRIDVVLPVAVNGDRHVTAVLRFHQSGEDGVLVSPVAALGDAKEMRVLFGELADDCPCAVTAAVVDEQDAAVFGDEPLRGQLA